jgi:formyl-CoA transferase
VLTVAELPDDPQIRHLDSFFDVTHPTAGQVHGIRSPVRYDGRREQPLNPPPTLGEHTDGILRELGYDDAAIADLRRENVV